MLKQDNEVKENELAPSNLDIARDKAKYPKPIFMDYLPWASYGGSKFGTLLIIDNQGFAYYYPLSGPSEGSCCCSPDCPCRRCGVCRIKQTGEHSPVVVSYRESIYSIIDYTVNSENLKGNNSRPSNLSDHTLTDSRMAHVGTFAFEKSDQSILSTRQARRRKREVLRFFNDTKETPKDKKKKNEENVEIDETNEAEKDHSHYLPFLPKCRKGPKKILLSPNKRLLLVHGCFFNNKSSVVVFALQDVGPVFLTPIFADLSFSYVDVCFSPNSKGIAAILRRFPYSIWTMSLPTLPLSDVRMEDCFSDSRVLYWSQQRSFANFTQQIAPDPRTIDHVAISGPGYGIDNRKFIANRIVSNVCCAASVMRDNNSPNVNMGATESKYRTKNGTRNGINLHYVTWNTNDPTGEYLLWSLDHTFQNSHYHHVVSSVTERMNSSNQSQNQTQTSNQNQSKNQAETQTQTQTQNQTQTQTQTQTQNSKTNTNQSEESSIQKRIEDGKQRQKVNMLLCAWYPRRLYPSLADTFTQAKQEKKTAMANYILDAAFSCQCFFCQKQNYDDYEERLNPLGTNTLSFVVLRALFDHKTRRHVHPYFGENDENDEEFDSDLNQYDSTSSASTCSSSDSDDESSSLQHKRRKAEWIKRKKEKSQLRPCTSQDSSEGTGVCVIPLDDGTERMEEEALKGEVSSPVWNKVCKSPNALRFSIWTRPVILGTIKSFACSIKNEGIKEIVDGRFCSSFLTQYDRVKEVYVMSQIRSSLRFWIGQDGSLRLICLNKDLWDRQLAISEAQLVSSNRELVQQTQHLQEKFDSDTDLSGKLKQNRMSLRSIKAQIGKLKDTHQSIIDSCLLPSVSWEIQEWFNISTLSNPDLVKVRISAAKCGYYITETKPDEQNGRKKQTASRGRKGKGNTSNKGATSGNSKTGLPQSALLRIPDGETWDSFLGNEDAMRGMGCSIVDYYRGIHLYRCANCHAVLLKPLKCDDCMAVSYCSQKCQREDFSKHRQLCLVRKVRKVNQVAHYEDQYADYDYEEEDDYYTEEESEDYDDEDDDEDEDDEDDEDDEIDESAQKKFFRLLKAKAEQ